MKKKHDNVSENSSFRQLLHKNDENSVPACRARSRFHLHEDTRECYAENKQTSAFKSASWVGIAVKNDWLCQVERLPRENVEYLRFLWHFIWSSRTATSWRSSGGNYNTLEEILDHNRVICCLIVLYKRDVVFFPRGGQESLEQLKQVIETIKWWKANLFWDVAHHFGKKSLI